MFEYDNMKIKYPVAIVSLLGILAGCKNNSKVENNANVVTEPALLTYSIVNAYPHNTSSFTEGLEWHDNNLYESTGDPDHTGASKLAKIDLKTGKDLQMVSLSKEYFGEGITILNGKVYQLTYKEGKCFVYDLKTFKKIGEFNYNGQGTGEGWGMTNDGKYLIMNDSSNNLYFRDPDTFNIVKTVGVFDNNGPLAMINEMEYVDGYIYSNVWLTDKIVKIDPATGKVVAKADFSYVLNKYAPGAITEADINNGAVLNGIAYDSVGKRFFITGKRWPKIFEVKFN
ncbi:MAG: glutaminyl-peptide cyclotransferase [Sediminibacterium sp.]